MRSPFLFLVLVGFDGSKKIMTAPNCDGSGYDDSKRFCWLQNDYEDSKAIMKTPAILVGICARDHWGGMGGTRQGRERKGTFNVVQNVQKRITHFIQASFVSFRLQSVPDSWKVQIGKLEWIDCEPG